MHRAVIALALALVVGTVLPASSPVGAATRTRLLPASVDERASAPGRVPPECSDPRTMALRVGVTASAIRQGRLTMGRFSITIDPAAIDLRAPTFDNPQWRLWYRSLIWLAPLAVESYTSTDAAGRRLVAAHVRAALRTNPG